MKSIYSIAAVTAMMAVCGSCGWAATITTATGNGADAYVQGNNSNTTADDNLGGVTELQAKRSGAFRKIYVRFDLSSVVSGQIGGASLSFKISSANWNINDQAAGLSYSVYGLNDGATAGNGRLGEDWLEGTGTATSSAGPNTAADDITFLNAPANDNTEIGVNTGTGTANGGQATLLGSFNIAYNSGVGTVVTFSNDALVNFLKADTNGMATIIITRTNGDTNSLLYFYAKESTASGMMAPTLNVEVPEPATMGVVSVGALWLVCRKK